MNKLIQRFRNDESGAITVDWVVLAAAMVLLGLLIMASIGGGAKESANWMATTMENMM